MSGAAVKVLHVPIESSSAAPLRAASASRWDGSEPVWVKAAWAAAPWPLWSVVAALGVPGGRSPAWLQGGLALAIVLGAMVAWAHRPPPAVLAARWLPTILGTGLLAELLANALTDVGRSPGLSALDDGARALSVWLICVGIYEVTPVLASASRIAIREDRARSLDVVAHALFLLASFAVHAWGTSWNGWYVSPWTAAIVALPLAAARSGPRTDVALPPRLAPARAVWGLALVAWIALALFVAGDVEALRQGAIRTFRRGADPLEGALWALPLLSVALSLVAAAHLLARARSVRHAPSGVVRGIDDGGITLELPGEGEPTWVAIESGPLPAEGATVTLLGVRPRGADVGPFRDGALRLSARRALTGPPARLARALAHRAALWLAWAAVSALGPWLRGVT